MEMVKYVIMIIVGFMVTQLMMVAIAPEYGVFLRIFIIEFGKVLIKTWIPIF